MQRITTDLAAAEFVTANREAHHPLFDGSELSVTLVRTALGPNVKPGLEVVRIGESSDRLGLATVRSRTPVPAVSGDIVAVRAGQLRRSGGAVARAVSSFIFLRRQGPGLERAAGTTAISCRPQSG